MVDDGLLKHAPEIDDADTEHGDDAGDHRAEPKAGVFGAHSRFPFPKLSVDCRYSTFYAVIIRYARRNVKTAGTALFRSAASAPLFRGKTKRKGHNSNVI